MILTILYHQQCRSWFYKTHDYNNNYDDDVDGDDMLPNNANILFKMSAICILTFVFDFFQIA